MSSSVDNRVVNMQFNNAQFEAGVKQTISSLDSLKQALKFNTAATSLNTLQSAVNHFSLASIETAVDGLSNKFSMLGVVGMTAVQNITNRAVNFVSNKISGTSGAAINQVKTGGWNRAQSVAQARFTLEGLLGDEDQVAAAFNKASEAVDGTAYSLDAAVSAASQLVASGLDIETELGGSLRAIAGTAAMTNRDFGEVAHIFTTIAGNGRVMGMQLTQLSTYGLNAAATLGQFGKYAGKTEAEIRELVSKGEISFEDFSEAMELAFGEHAAKANDTLTGVLSNTRSALSRIGEIFASGIIENTDFITFIDTARQGINRVKDSLVDLQEPFKKLVSAVSNFMKQYTNAFTDKTFRFSGVETLVNLAKTGLEYVTELITKFTDLKEEIEDGVAASALEEAAEKIIYTTEHLQMAHDSWEKGTSGNGQARVDALGDEYQAVQDLVNAYVYGGYSWEAAEKMISDSTEDAMSTVVDSSAAAGEALEEASTKTKLITVAVGTIKSFGSGVSSIFNSIRRLASRVGTSIKKAFNWGTLLTNINTAGVTFSKWAGYFEITEERADKLGIVFDGVVSVLSAFKKAIGNIVRSLTGNFGPSISDIIDWLLDMSVAVGDNLSKFADWIDKNDILEHAFLTIAGTIGGAIAAIKEFFIKLYNLPSVQEMIDRLTALAKLIGTTLAGYFGDAKDKVGEFFDKFNDSDTSFTDTVLVKLLLLSRT